MKRLFFIFLLFFSISARADVVALNFASVPLLTFAQASFREILKRDYVISPEVLSLDRKITISIKNINKDQVQSFITNILLTQGIAVSDRDGFIYLEAVKVPGPSPAETVFPVVAHGDINLKNPVSSDSSIVVSSIVSADDTDIYFPENRSSEFIASALNSIFPKCSTSIGSKLVIKSSKEKIIKILELARLIDTASKKITISASFVEVATGRSNNLGISILANFLNSQAGITLGNVSSGSALTIKNSSLQVVVDALKSDSRFHQLSNPSLTLDELEHGSLSVGNETPTVGGTSQDKNGSLIQQIVYRNSGVILDVLPKIYGSGAVSLAVDAQVSSFQNTTTGVSGSPTLSKRQIKTSLTFSPGTVVIMGGLKDQKTSDSNSGLSFLPDSFRVSSNSNSATDLVLLLSASVE